MTSIQTFTAKIGESYKATQDANDYIERVKYKKEIINILTATNDYFFLYNRCY